KNDRQAYFSAKEAEGVEDLQICLPHLLGPKVKAIDIYYHVLRCKPVVLKLYDDVSICAMEVMCEQTEKWLKRNFNSKSRSPKLIIFAQPNSSDIGCCMLMDPNFVGLADIADFLRCDLLVFDYVGYGVSDGVSAEKSVYDTVERVYKYATDDLGYDPNDIILIGFSLGTAAMVHIASQNPDESDNKDPSFRERYFWVLYPQDGCGHNTRSAMITKMTALIDSLPPINTWHEPLAFRSN
ncbi:hypothetical protein OESDEN_13265, partial [Oesophagostomum dentatum]